MSPTKEKPDVLAKFVKGSLRGLGIVSALIFTFAVYRLKSNSGDSLAMLIPGFFLYMPVKNSFTRALWPYFVNHESLPIIEQTHLPEMHHKGGSLDFEAFQKLTGNFRYPAVVRGLFQNTTATKMWDKKGYLASKIGHYEIPVVQRGQHNSEGSQNGRMVEKFGDAMDHVIQNKNSMKYLFFPVKSRTKFVDMNGNTVNLERDIEDLGRDVNIVTSEDLDVENRLWKGFGTHKSYLGGQIIAGRGTGGKSRTNTTGTGWHCAAGNNWFVQVVGMKRWYFVDQTYSAWMKAARVGVGSFGAPNEMQELQKYLPVKWVDLKAGDLLYNPDWSWHRIENYEGMSIGSPLRELNISLTLQNNLQFTTVTLWNQMYEKITGKPMPGFA